jgi:ubiquinone/menaquinone biosynthesis C-methylase UbiE
MEAYRYARVYDPLLFPFVRPIRKKVVSLVEERRYRKILDVCCGTGDQLKLLKRHGFDAQGIDLSEAMLGVARSGRVKADCTVQDAAQMRFESGRFDLAMVVFALHEKEGPVARKILEEMLRVTEAGGHLLIVDYEFTRRTDPFARAFITLIERIAGGEHYWNFKAYIENGGLPPLLSGLPLEEVQRHYFGRHGIVLTLLEKTAQG